MNIRIIILSLTLLIAATPAAYSQKGLDIEPFFEENTPHNPDASVNVVSITGNKLKEHDLSIYRSVSVTGDEALAQRVERAVTRDGTKAESREVSLKRGRLYFGFIHCRRLTTITGIRGRTDISSTSIPHSTVAEKSH